MLEKSDKNIAGSKEQQLEAQQQQQGRRFLSPMAQMDRLFDEAFRRPFLSSLFAPRQGGEMELDCPVDIYEDGESVIVKAEIPGVKKENLDIQLTTNSITISGTKSSEERVQQKDFYRLERSYGSFTRRFQLPVETMTEQARASFRDGVLEVRIPKSVSALRSRKLSIE